ncbi:glycoside hydrolase family 3 protein [Microbacterium hominis]|uniref:glycoside hydrolase family 3 N-terminal domain-containing protein n=1 Tax=Microbacterium hominis TaxID=162426 RepID=UPI0019664E2D|nr:glycoside hydrolase family 3 N-terminal domain-containing protein [Microbacterium hominis]QRY40109.1 glycoside hydrolase family 3 protein [Microbacterium hominis]
MKALPKKGIAIATGFGLAIALAGCSMSDEALTYSTRDVSDGTTGFVIVQNPNGGAQLSYTVGGGIALLEEKDGNDTLAFKDLNGNGVLDAFEDWRIAPQERASAYAKTLSAEQISGLMLFSSHERSPGDGLTDAQKTYLEESKVRNILNAGGSDVTENVTWVNAVQAYAEELAGADAPYIPANFSSDPRSEAQSGSSYTETGTGVSLWPSVLGLAATGSADTVEDFGRVASSEYRGLGISNALSPQIDLATEPRWLRVSGTLGEDAALAKELAAAYVTGFQSTYDQDGRNVGWGLDSVPTTIKHAPGDGAGEGGRESHTDVGKYAVFPGDNLDEHADVFAAAKDSLGMMTSYSIQLDGEGKPLLGDQAVGTAYNAEALKRIRDEIGFEGAIVTDWGVMSGAKDEGALIATGWGAEDMAPVERYYTVLKNGVDMFGGVNDATYILQAYDLWNERYAAGEVEVDADTRWQQSGARILTAYFAPGLFDSPFVDLEKSEKTVGSEENIKAGFDAQLDSVVMLKNDGTVAAGADWTDKTVYIPHTYDVGHAGLFGAAEYTEGATLSLEAADDIFGTVVTDTVEYDADGRVVSMTAPDLSDVDAVFVGLRSPNNGTPFSASGKDADTGEWYPFSLQWAPYTADGDAVRTTSISGDTLPDGTKENRSYFGQASRISNAADIDAFARAVAAVQDAGKDIPIVTIVKANNPVVPAEFEATSDVVLVGFGVSDQATLQVATGAHEPQGRLPIGFPLNMDAVEAQQEDVGKDMATYVDAAGNDWAFGFGLNYSGVITR